MDGIEFVKNNWKPYKGKENISWEIKWDSVNNIFAFFLYVQEKKGIRVYRELIPNEILKMAMQDTRRINDIVETCIDKLNKLNGVNFREY